MHHNSIDIATAAGYLLRIDCWEAEKRLKTTPSSECALNALAIDDPLEYTRLYLESNMQIWIWAGMRTGRRTVFYVTRRVSGTQMVAHDFYEGDYAAKARFVGEIIGQLHLILCQAKTSVNDVNLYESVKNWALPKSKDILLISEWFCQDYLNEFGKLYDKLPKQIIHRDPNPSNIIVSQD